MVHFETIGQIADTCSAFVGVSDDDNFVSAVNKFLLAFSTTQNLEYDFIRWTIGRYDFLLHPAVGRRSR